MKKSGILNKNVFYFLIVLLIISVFLNYRYYKSKQEENRCFSIFINDFYYEIDDSVNILKNLTQDSYNGGNLNNMLIELNEHFNLLIFMLDRCTYYMSNVVGKSWEIKLGANIIKEGTEYKGYNIPPFDKDNKLSQGELNYLRAFEVYMEKIREGLRSEESTYNVNESIDKHQFNEIISDIMDKYSYTLFLEEYINTLDK